MSINTDSISPVTTTNLMDSSNSEVENAIRKLQEINDGFDRNRQMLRENIQMLDRNNERLDNLQKKLNKIDEGIREEHYYRQAFITMIFGVAVFGLQKMKELGSSAMRMTGYPNVPLFLQGTSRSVELQRDLDSASSSPSIQPVGKKNSAFDFSPE